MRSLRYKKSAAAPFKSGDVLSLTSVKVGSGPNFRHLVFQQKRSRLNCCTSLANNEWDLIISDRTWLYRRLHAESMPLLDWLCLELWNSCRGSEAADFQDTSFILISWMVLSVNGTSDPADLLSAFPARYQHTVMLWLPSILPAFFSEEVIHNSIYQNFSPRKILLCPCSFTKSPMKHCTD